MGNKQSVVDIYDIEYIFLDSGTATWKVLVIGAHQSFEQADFFMPKLFLKELWLGLLPPKNLPIVK